MNQLHEFLLVKLVKSIKEIFIDNFNKYNLNKSDCFFPMYVTYTTEKIKETTIN